MKTPFLFGIHCHQPYENFYHVVDYAVKVSYAPFLEVALKNKDFKFAGHYSGWLLDYIRQHHKDVFANLKKLSDLDQIEFFTGGYYEPILTTIPSDDRRGQIDKLSSYIKKYFGQTPNGLWLTERVWDPAIIPDLVSCGVENVIVDDYHLIASGFERNSIKGYFRTEQDGEKINIFPIDKMLRYLTPFKPEQEVTDYINSTRENGHKLITCFDDGEKFGLWPSTNEWVYKNGWLQRFIDNIRASGTIEFAHYKDVQKQIKPIGIAYLPITSYVEMGEWALFPERFIQFENVKKYLESSEFQPDIDYFLKGTIWKNFLVKYPEANRLHKRCLDLSVNSRKYKKDEKFIDLLYQSQCNDSLWHGVFGGLYLPNLRNNAWSSLIEAECRYEELANIRANTILLRDIDIDSYDEAYYIGKIFNAQFSSRDNGQMVTLELKKEHFNLMNTIARRREGYHYKYNPISKDEIEKRKNSDEAKSIHDENHDIDSDIFAHIKYDWYTKNSFIDHFTYNYNLDQFKTGDFLEIGDFVNQPADITVDKDKIIFNRTGGLFTAYGNTAIDMRKTYTIKNDKIDFEFNIRSAKEFKCEYLSELNFHFADISNVTINNMPLNIDSSLKSKIFSIKDSYTKREILLEFTDLTELSFYTIFTVSQSESGVDLTAQGVTIIIRKEFDTSMILKGSLQVI